MQDRRVDRGGQRGAGFAIEVDGQTMLAYEGETIAAVLQAAGRKIFRTTSKNGRPRGLYCGIGLCHDCLVVLNGEPNVQACQTLVSPGCRIDTQNGLGEVKQALAEGAVDLNEVKRRTRVGMGLCQGRMCAPGLLEILAREHNLNPDQLASLQLRPPVKPVPLPVLAKHHS